MQDWFTSDTHFNHENIIKYCNRPYNNVLEMDEALIENWNRVVGVKDRVWHLGDFGIGFKQGYLQTILNRLNGQKFLIIGNHDYRVGVKLKGWVDILGLKPFDKFFLCHYPMHSWMGSSKGVINLHGHTHGNLPLEWNRMDVGVDVWGYAPVPKERLEEKSNKMKGSLKIK